MKLAILTSGILPVPAVQGGAVENLIDFYLEYNEQHRLHDITVYSIWHPDVEKHPALKSEVNHYYYIKVSGWFAKFKKRLYKCFHSNMYYHYTIEYYLHESIKDIIKKCFDIIIIENRPFYALKLKEITDAKLVFHLHNDKLDCKTLQAKEVYNAASCILTVSDYIKKRVQTINPQDTKTKTLHNGINLSAFSRNVSVNRNMLGLQDDDFVLVFSGRVNHEKGIMELVEAMILLNDYPHIKLLVIGSSFYGNADNKNEFAISLKKKAELLDNRIIFTSFIPYSSMPGYLCMADLAVIPSVWDDHFPTTVLEAQAMGLPIIATRRGGIPEKVTKENAILLQTDTHFVSNLAATILDLYKQPEKRRQMASASLERARLFDKDTYTRNFFDMI